MELAVTMKCPVDRARPLANFPPNLWGDYFLTTLCDEATNVVKEQEAKELKEKVREKLVGSVVGDPKERLILIDVVEQLGVSYHFEEEIENSLQEIHKKHSDDDISYKHDLHYTALRFRLLRQHGFHVSCGAFEIFKNEKGSFKDSLKSDVQGLLNLYEASFLRIHGENILEEARAFTTSHLTSMAMHVASPLAEQINHALKHPLHRSSTRLHSRYFMSFYENHPSHDQILLRFAKLDFDLLRSLHKKEIRDIIRWSKDLEISSNFPYARDRDVEGFFWILSIYYEPKYSLARLIHNKLFKLSSINDDTYDAYGTFQELQLFTRAIQRWDKNLINELPDYMKFLYKTILDTFEELEQDLAKRGESHAVYYVQRELKAVCEAYLQEAEWNHQGYVPTYDEYMKNGVESSAYFYTLFSCYQGMAKIATRNVFEWVRHDVKLSRASAVLSRILNDIAGHKAEQSRGQASAVECLMVHDGLTLEEAIKKLQQQEEEAWMSINEGMLRPYHIPLPLLKHIINLNRVFYDVYSIDDDGYTTQSQRMQQKVKAVLIDSAML